MFCTLKNTAQSFTPRTHILATLVSFVAFQATRINLDKLYAASAHPVDFATGQLAFNGDTIFSYYGAMREGGTFDMYIQTQLFDFLFIASVILFGVFLGTLIARLGPPKSASHLMGIGAAFFAFCGGGFDALENLISFLLMQYETSIPQALAFMYSGFAAAKFIALTLAMGLALSALVSAGITAALKFIRPKHAV